MNVSAQSVGTHHPEQPHHHQNDKDSPKHNLFSFCLNLLVSLDSGDKRKPSVITLELEPAVFQDSILKNVSFESCAKTDALKNDDHFCTAFFMGTFKIGGGKRN